MTKEERYVWFEPSKGPNNTAGFELRYLEKDTNGHSKGGNFYTPSFGFWFGFNSFMMNKTAVMQSATRKALEDEYELLWIDSRPSETLGCKLLGL